MNFTRRNFLSSALSTAGLATLGSGCASIIHTPTHDDNLTLFLSDIHISGEKGKPVYHRACLAKIVDAVLKMNPLPKRCVIFGDLAYLYGMPEDYAASKPILERLIERGIDLTIGMGNHDNRVRYKASWPELAAKTRIPGRFVSVANCPDCDIIMTDSLKQGPDWNKMGPVDGEYDDAQRQWLETELPRWKRPFFVCAHHPFSEISAPGKPLYELYLSCPKMAGYIYGHNHQWRPGIFRKPGWPKGKGPDPMKRQLCLPSTGHWGDIGYVLFRTSPTKAEATLFQHDYYFPRPYPKEERDPIWDNIVAEHQNAFCVFNMPR